MSDVTDPQHPIVLPEKPALEGLEARWNDRWERAATYRFDRRRTRGEVYAIDTPPPTVSGSLHVASGLAPGARLDIEGYSGNVTLSLPTDVSASFRVETFSGNIDNALGVEGQRTGDRGPGKRLELITGAGDARVHVETFSGNVELERRP